MVLVFRDQTLQEQAPQIQILAKISRLGYLTQPLVGHVWVCLKGQLYLVYSKNFEFELNEKQNKEQIDREYPKKQIEFDIFSKREKPFIAAVNGLAFGGGMHWIMDCDIRITSEGASFSLPEPKIGMPANYGSNYLPDLIPLGESLYYLLTSDQMSAEDAYRLGLVHEVLSLDELMPRAISIASMIIQGAPLAIAATKKMVYFSRAETNLTREQYAAPLLGNIQNSSDIEEGRLAFIEKRKPKWSG